MGLLSAACRIIGVGMMLLAFGCTLVAVGTVWTVGHIKTTGESLTNSPGAAPQQAAAAASGQRQLLQSGSVFDQYIYLTLWRREVDRDPGTDESATWQSYISDVGRDEEYCPERNGQTYGNAYTRIQAAEACALIAMIFSFLTLIGSIVSMLGRLVSRAIFGIPAFIAIVAACGSVIAWMEFYNMCEDNFCHRYVNQLGSTEGVCGLGVGIGFMLAAIGLSFFALIPLCAAGPRDSKRF